MRYALRAALCAFALLALAAPAAADDKITGQTYVRHDGGTDAGIQHCNNTATNPTPVPAAGGDADPNDGGSRRQSNEPYTVVDPTNPLHIYAGWNDYCLTDLGAGWQGFAFSTNGGATWTDSIVPGYPQDTSAEGMASPLFGNHTDAGDPIAAFDNDGNLFVGGISFNRVGAILGHVYVATYGTNPHASGYPVDYLRTVIVGTGTPSRNFFGIFQDKPMLEVDRTGNTATDGNVYVCWSRFTGFGQNKIYFSRSTDSGATFSRPVAISRDAESIGVQGCDIAIEHDGDVYVTWRTFAAGRTTSSGLAFARSTDGGQSFSRAELIRPIVVYNPFDTDRNCGDGPLHCPSDFVFHRVPLEPRVTADQSGGLAGVYLAYNAVKPESIVASQTTYSSAGGGRVGQSLTYVIHTVNNGGSWSEPVAVDGAPAGHQFFPDIDAHAGKLALVWQDNRTDPAYSVQRPIGNTYVSFGGAMRAQSSGTNIVNSFVSSLTSSALTTPLTFAPSTKVSAVGHQSQYEMFSSRDLPFHGDYNWISVAERPNGSVFAYMSWTDNRDVVPGQDPRETQPDPFVDGFDVQQCRVDLGAPAPALDPNIPLARRDAPFSGDNCGNGGGLDQNIYGESVELGAVATLTTAAAAAEQGNAGNGKGKGKGKKKH